MTPAFRDWVERARSEHVGVILNTRQITLPGKGNRRAGPCPKCGGTDRFAVDLEKQVFNCRGCGGKGHGAISLVEFLDGVSFVQAVETITGEPPPKEDVKPKARKRTERGKLIETYDYTDEHDALGYQVLRYEPKTFSQRRRDPHHEGAWIENLNGVRLVPYRLPDLIEGVANGHPIYWVEGEKDANTGASLGLITTTTAMGLAGKGHWERGIYDEFFKGANVILMPDQDADPKKGNQLARVIAKRLKPIAASVALLKLPAKDLSLWVEQGGTREALDALPIEEMIVPNGNGHSTEGMAGFAQDWQPPGAPAPKLVPLIYPFPIIAKEIPRRPWLVPGFLLRRHLSVLVAPPGSGKSLLTLQIAIMMATATAWGDWYPRGRIKTLIINSEDDSDEMRRRFAAAVNVMSPTGKTLEDYQEELREHVAIADQPERIIIAKSDFRTKTVIRQPAFDDIIATIKAGKFDVVIIDPFAETFEGDENSNSELKWAAVLWREIARQTNCAVLLVHHTRKYAAGGAGDMDAARGAGALVGVARVVSTVFTMTEPEAQMFLPADADVDQRHKYLRFDDAKANLSLVTFKARWFEKLTITLPNGTDDEPADQVGALKPWKPASVFDKVDVGLARNILLAIDKGIISKTGPKLATVSGEKVEPVPDLYTLTRRGKTATRWAGDVVKEFVDPCSDKDAQRLLGSWIKSGVLYEVMQETSTSRGQQRKGLKVKQSRMPGTLISEDKL